MKKYNRSLPYTISTVYVAIVKIWTVIIKTYFPNNEILKNIGTANGIFKKAASDFDYSVDYLIVIVYVMLLIVFQNLCPRATLQLFPVQEFFVLN